MDKAIITRNFVINSKDDLWDFLRGKDIILKDSIELKVFIDHMFLAKYGCPCDEKENLNEAQKIYLGLSDLDPKIFEQIKKITESSKIIIKNNEEIIIEV